ncbi:patatin-like phospholipase family protein [Marinagarivorans cellulosilyticus]|nr:patatin-like phospholipase family protein [Marinagarivorans cellulosilyticus]
MKNRLVFAALPLLLIISIAFNVAVADQRYAKSSPSVDDGPCSEVDNRPCVALVLGGGGAKGGAHIGVIQALEERHIPVDLVVGTSIGAFVGGLYASGKDSAAIAQLFQQADWNSGYRDNLTRSDIPMRRKRQLDEFQIHVDLGLTRKGVSIPKGFIQGQSMKTLLDSMLGTYPNFTSFDQLPIPFRAVAADAETGEEIVLSYGDLATAMQASMSLPGIVRPIVHEGRILVDGGIANNVPISVAKNLGADIVIAVDIGASANSKDELNSGVAILLQLTKFLTGRNVAEQKALLTSSDILIIPELGDIGLLSFDRVLEAVDKGYQQTLTELNQRSLAIIAPGLNDGDVTPLPSQPGATTTQNLPFDDEILISAINLSNNTRLNDDYILHRMGVAVGENMAVDEINTGINRLYGQGTIARITTSWDDLEGDSALNIRVDEKEWGPGYLDFKFNFEDDFSSFSEYQLGASYRLTNLSQYGAEWVSSFEVGTEKVINTELYWPIKKTGFFWDVFGEYERTVFEYKDAGRALGTVQARDSTVSAGIGWNTWDKFEVTLSALYRRGVFDVPDYLDEYATVKDIHVDQRGGILEVNFDSLDNASFPSRGWNLKAILSRTRDEVLNLSNYSNFIDAQYNGVLSYQRHSIRGLLRYQSTLNHDALSLLGSASLGGFLNLSGNPSNFISGQHVRFASGVYTYQLAENDFGAIDFPLYLGFSVEAGNAWYAKSNVDYSDLIHSSSLFLGWDTPIGPAYLAYGRSDTGGKSLYVFLGVTF